MGTEGIIFRKSGCHNGRAQLLGCQQDRVAFCIGVKPVALDKNVGSSCEGGPINTHRLIICEPTTFGLLELLLSIADTFELVIFKLAFNQRHLAQHDHYHAEPDDAIFRIN